MSRVGLSRVCLSRVGYGTGVVPNGILNRRGSSILKTEISDINSNSKIVLKDP